MIKIDEAVILIRINQAYSKDMSKQDLYSYTRGQWRLSVKRASKAKLVFSLFKGNIIEVYQIKKWVPAGVSMNRDNRLIDRNPGERISNRYEFIGEVANQEIREKYLNKSLKHLFKKGNSNPIMYVNC